VEGSALRGIEGELVAVRISTEPRLLERLLDALAQLDFPINPQIYHDAVSVFAGPDGRERTAPVAVVEFPAWAGRMEAVRDALHRHALDGAAVTIRGMLEDIHSDSAELAVSPGAKGEVVIRYRHAARVA
jgi:hypothetical protein